MANQLQTSNVTDPNLVEIAQQFQSASPIVRIQQYGSGNINQTFLVTLKERSPFILQQLNTTVFRQPELVMHNICVLSDHVNQKIPALELVSPRRWLFPQVLLTSTGKNCYLGADNSFWRAFSFIDNSQSFDTIQDLHHAQEIGYGLGMFHSLVNDLPTKQLADTLVGFHITPSYLAHYQQVLTTTKVKASPEKKYCQQFISDRPDLPYILETAKDQGKIKLRIIHGDPKINNIMLDCTTHQAVAAIDLDTVKPGLIHYDIGDCLRSGCNPLGEETDRWEQVTFELEFAQAILEGYLGVASQFLTKCDRQYIYDAIRLLAFELGLRFFTDYLEGDVYFGAKYPEHNLQRALVQFQLTSCIEAQGTALKNMIQEIS